MTCRQLKSTPRVQILYSLNSILSGKKVDMNKMNTTNDPSKVNELWKTYSTNYLRNTYLQTYILGCQKKIYFISPSRLGMTIA